MLPPRNACHSTAIRRRMIRTGPVSRTARCRHAAFHHPGYLGLGGMRDPMNKVMEPGIIFAFRPSFCAVLLAASKTPSGSTSADREDGGACDMAAQRGPEPADRRPGAPAIPESAPASSDAIL